MAELLIDGMDDVAPWAASEPDGSPSSAITLTAAPSGAPTGDPSVTLAVAGGGAGHRVERALSTPVDLRQIDDVLLWVRGDHSADGSPARPFALELRLGSTARPIDAPSNRWQRYVPFPASKRWSPVLVGVHDLPANVRSACNQVRFVAVAGAWRAGIGAIRGIRPELVPDVDTGLRARFDDRLQLDGAAVAARLVPAEGAPPDGPHFDIAAVGVGPAPGRQRSESLSTDFTDESVVVRPPARPLDLTYRITAIADDRAAQAVMVQFVLDELARQPALVAGGMPWPMALVDADGTTAGGALTVRIEALQRPPADRSTSTFPFNEVTVEVDHRGAV